KTFRRLLRPDTRHPVIGEALDEGAFRIEGPSNDFTDRARLHEAAHFVAIDEAVLEEGPLIAELADADEREISLLGQIDDISYRLLGEEKLLLVDRAGNDRDRHRIVGRTHRIGDAH